MENKIPGLFTPWAYPSQKAQLVEIQFSPDGKHVAIAPSKSSTFTATIYDATAAAAGKPGIQVQDTRNTKRDFCRLARSAVGHDKKLAVTTVNAGRDLLLWEADTGKVVREIKGKAKTPVRVGWLKDKNRYVLAWGYGTDPGDKEFGKLTRAFDLDQLQ